MRILYFLGVPVFAALPAFGQGVATLQGRLTDPTGGVIPGATVTATQVSTNIPRTALTDDEGRYFFASLPIGEGYQL